MNKLKELLQQQEEKYKMLQAIQEDTFLTLSVQREGMGEYDYRPVEPDDIAKDRQELIECIVEEVDQMKKKLNDDAEEHERGIPHGYNQALTDIQTLLQEALK